MDKAPLYNLVNKETHEAKLVAQPYFLKNTLFEQRNRQLTNKFTSIMLFLWVINYVPLYFQKIGLSNVLANKFTQNQMPLKKMGLTKIKLLL